ncbi:MAG: SDR family oxidoreductase [Planctomycetota bacterium]|nr:MAG: SDR family oxidoreductase [Planctomycetota bacterium]
MPSSLRMNELFSVDGQVVLVSGGSRGIGKAIAAGFAQNGAHVVVTGRDEPTLQKTAAELSAEAPHPVLPHVCDVSRLDEIHATVDAVLDRFDRIDTLVNVAGVNRRKPALDVTPEDYDFILDINLRGAFFMAQAVGRHMVERRSGSQIHIASLNTDRPLVNVLPYAASKAGLGHMTRVLAAEWGPAGVRVNALAPGFILTDLTRKLWSNQQMLQWGETNTPLRRLGRPEDMVGTALFLASPASAFLTGQIVYVDGGFNAAVIWPIPEDGGM